MARSELREPDSFGKVLSNLFGSSDTESKETERQRAEDIQYRNSREYRDQKEKEFEELQERRREYQADNPRNDDRPINQERYNQRYNN